MESLTYSRLQRLEKRQCGFIKENLFYLTRKSIKEMRVPFDEYFLFKLFAKIYSAYALKLDKIIMSGRP